MGESFREPNGVISKKVSRAIYIYTLRDICGRVSFFFSEMYTKISAPFLLMEFRV